MKHDIAGWYEIGQLWKESQLRYFYIDHIHVLESDDPDNIKVGLYLSDGTMIAELTVTEGDIEKAINESNIQPIDKPDHL
jgi:regulatory protein YycH of two-component signal transduction system YycFG